MKKYKDFERYAKIFEAVARGSTMTAAAKSNGISGGRVQEIIRDLQRTMLLPEITGADTYKVPDIETIDHVASIRKHADFWLRKLEVLRAHVNSTKDTELKRASLIAAANELLELAAKAAGIPIVPRTRGNPLWPFKHDEAKSGKRGHWNPLEDDGDALRLAMKLRLSIDHNPPADPELWVVAHRNGCEGCYAPVMCVEDDFEDESQRGPATRCAIVRAAAEIGRAMRKGGAA